MRVILINLVALVGLGLAVFFLRSEVLRLERYQAELKATEVQAGDFNHLRQLFLETAPSRRLMNDYFVRLDNLAVFIERLESLATTTEVSLRFTKAKVRDEDKDWPQVEFAFRANGPFANLSRFILLLEAMPLSLRFQQADLVYEPPRSDNVRGDWSGEFVLTAAGLPKNYVEQN